MKKTLFHGSNKVIEKPQFGIGKVNNDYGLGFYCTDDYDLAGEWAVSVDRDGYVNEYSLDVTQLRILDINSSDYCILDWLVILLDNRKFDIQSDFGNEAIRYLRDSFGIDYGKYDVIRGYRADDSYFTFAQDFLNNMISLGTLEKALKLGCLGEQTVLKSKKAFKCIDFIGYHKVKALEYYPVKESRDLNARKDYRKLRKEPWSREEIYLMQIIDRELKRDDLCI